MFDKIIDLIKSGIGEKLISVVGCLCKAVQTAFSYLEKRQDAKNRKEKQKRKDRLEKEIDDACDKGDIGDLLDVVDKAEKFSVILLSAVLLAGCAQTPKIYATKPWEGRYDTVKQAKAAIDGADLGKGESIWIVSNETMKRIVKEKINGDKNE